MLATIYNYSDYCEILKDYFTHKKLKNPHFSYGVWARQLGLKSPATLTMLIKGQRSPSDSLVEKICENLNLKEREKDYFQDLVRLKKTAGDVTLNVLVMERIANSYADGKIKVVDLDMFKAISNWHYYAIREMVLLKDFQDNAEWIVARLNHSITTNDCLDAMKTLVRLGLLKRDDVGKLVQASGFYNTPDNNQVSEAIQRFHEGALDLAKQSIRGVTPEDRELAGVTFGIKKANLGKAKALIREFKKRFCKLIEEKDAEEIYQLQMVFFPLTKRAKK